MAFQVALVGCGDSALSTDPLDQFASRADSSLGRLSVALDNANAEDETSMLELRATASTVQDELLSVKQDLNDEPEVADSENASELASAIESQRALATALAKDKISADQVEFASAKARVATDALSANEMTVVDTTELLASVRAAELRAKRARKKRSQSSTSPPTSPEPTEQKSQSVGDWPAGTRAWTVILVSETNRAAAESAASRAVADGLEDVGILYSSDYNSLRPGYWVAYSGVMSKAKAQSAQAEARNSGFRSAYVRYVSP